MTFKGEIDFLETVFFGHDAEGCFGPLCSAAVDNAILWIEHDILIE
jgi:hypothetical protein